MYLLCFNEPQRVGNGIALVEFTASTMFKYTSTLGDKMITTRLFCEGSWTGYRVLTVELTEELDDIRLLLDRTGDLCLT